MLHRNIIQNCLTATGIFLPLNIARRASKRKQWLNAFISSLFAPFTAPFDPSITDEASASLNEPVIEQLNGTVQSATAKTYAIQTQWRKVDSENASAAISVLTVFVPQDVLFKTVRQASLQSGRQWSASSSNDGKIIITWHRNKHLDQCCRVHPVCH